MNDIIELIEQGFEVTFSHTEEGQGIHIAVMLDCEAIATRYVHSTSIPFEREGINLVDEVMRLAMAVRSAELTSRRNRL